METARNPKRPTSGHFHCWLVADPSEAEWERGKWAEQAALWDSGIEPELPTFRLKIEQFCQKLRTCFGSFLLFVFVQDFKRQTGRKSGGEKQKRLGRWSR